MKNLKKFDPFQQRDKNQSITLFDNLKRIWSQCKYGGPLKREQQNWIVI